MANNYISIRGIFFIGLGIVGSIVGSQIIKTGPHPDMTTFLYSELVKMICFIAIILGIALWSLDIYLACNRISEKGTTNDDLKSWWGKSPREMNSLKLACVGMLLFLGVLNFLRVLFFLGVWNLQVSQSFWLYLGVFCSVIIVGFSLLYILGYYVLFKSL